MPGGGRNALREKPPPRIDRKLKAYPCKRLSECRVQRVCSALSNYPLSFCPACSLHCLLLPAPSLGTCGQFFSAPGGIYVNHPTTIIPTIYVMSKLLHILDTLMSEVVTPFETSLVTATPKGQPATLALESIEAFDGKWFYNFSVSNHADATQIGLRPMGLALKCIANMSPSESSSERNILLKAFQNMVGSWIPAKVQKKLADEQAVVDYLTANCLGMTIRANITIKPNTKNGITTMFNNIYPQLTTEA